MSSTDTRIYNVLEYGAVPDGTTLNTEALQSALDKAAEAGGKIVIPPGVYMTGTLVFPSGITLELQAGATILGSPNLDDYRQMSWGQHIDRTPWHLLVFHHVHDVKITGGGTIDGNGPAFWEDTNDDGFVTREPDKDRAAVTWIKANKEKRPSPMIEVTGCHDMRFEDIHITNSGGWNLHLHNSNFIWIRGVKLTSNLMGPNNDGFDITGCHDVMISDCYLSCCDDAICLKTTPDSQTCERIVVTNCVIRTKCVGLKLGCNESFQDYKDITFSNCVIFESSRGIGLYTKEGGNMENLTISNIVIDTKSDFMMNRPIHFDQRFSDDTGKGGVIRNVNISNVVANTDGRILLTAQDGGMIENITLRDIRINYPTIDDPNPLGYDIGGGQFSNKTPEAKVARGALVAQNVKNLVVDNFQVQWPETDENGKVKTPEEWISVVKGANGTEQIFTRDQFNDDTIPPFHVAWLKNVHGGYINAVMSEASHPEVEKFHLEQSTLKSTV